MFVRHAEIWGTTERASPVEVAVRDVTTKPARSCARYEWNQKARGGKGGWRLVWEVPFASSPLPYALFSFQGKQPASRNGDPEEPPANFIETASFTLRLRYPEELSEDVEAAVWAWVNFGGLGARTRRGCGVLLCKEIAPKNASDLEPWFKSGAFKLGGAVRDWPGHEFDRIVGDAATRFGMSIDARKFRESRLGRWRTFLESIAEGEDPEIQMTRMIERDLLDHAALVLPIDGRDVMSVLGLDPGPAVARALHRARELFRSGIIGRDELLKALVQADRSKTE